LAPLIVTDVGLKDSPMIRNAWIENDRDVKIDLLWRYEAGAIDWDNVMHRAKSSDVILIAPQYHGLTGDKEDRDNAPAAEFYRRVLGLDGFSKSVELSMGQSEKTTVYAFIKTRKSLKD